MAHFKRGRRKNARAGCLHCKPQKANGQRLRLKVKGSDLRRLDSAAEQVNAQAQGEDATDLSEQDREEDVE